MEEKKSNKGLVTLIVILIILFFVSLGAGGYIYYAKADLKEQNDILKEQNDIFKKVLDDGYNDQLNFDNFEFQINENEKNSILKIMGLSDEADYDFNENLIRIYNDDDEESKNIKLIEAVFEKYGKSSSLHEYTISEKTLEENLKLYGITQIAVDNNLQFNVRESQNTIDHIETDYKNITKGTNGYYTLKFVYLPSYLPGDEECEYKSKAEIKNIKPNGSKYEVTEVLYSCPKNCDVKCKKNIYTFEFSLDDNNNIFLSDIKK